MDSPLLAVPAGMADADVLGVAPDVPTFLRVAPQAPTVDFAGLAALLHISRSTIVTLHSRARHRLPPACRVPGSREPVWIVTDVLAWLRRHPEGDGATAATDVQTPERAPQKRRPGRPTKAEQIAAHKAAAANAAAVATSSEVAR